MRIRAALPLLVFAFFAGALPEQSPAASAPEAPLAPVAIADATPPPLPPTELKVPTEAQVREMMEELEAMPSVFTPPAGQRKAWEALALDRAAIVELAERLMKEPVAALPDDLYLDFGKTGRRNTFEKPFNSRLSRAALLALAEGVEFQGRFLPALREVLEAILSEKSWVLPAHDAKDATFHGEKLHVDLGVAARVATLATIDQWLGPQLGEPLRDRLRREIHRRAIAPYLNAVYQPTGGPVHKLGWIKGNNNWNAVCHAGLVYAALATVEDRFTRAKVVAAAVQNTENFLNGFTPDGYCSEGMAYWNYGFGHFVFLAETVARATSGKVDLYRHPSIGNISVYPFRFEMAPGLYPAFADSAPGSRPSESILRLLARRVELPVEIGAQKEFSPGRSSLGLPLYQLDLRLSPPPVSTGLPSAGKSLSPLRGFFPAAGVLVCRPAVPSAGLAVAMKGGHNQEHHNHHDVGSYVVASRGVAVLVDPGGEIYTRRTFSPQRYESTVINSYGHPVPLMDGRQQRGGREACGRFLEVASGEAGERLVLDMAAAYDVPGLRQVRRTFSYDRTGATAFAVTDEMALSRPVTIETALITFGKITRQGPSRFDVRDGKGGVSVTVDTGGLPFEVVEEELPEKLPFGRIARRLGIRLSEPVAEARVHLQIEPLPATETGAD